MISKKILLAALACLGVSLAQAQSSTALAGTWTLTVVDNILPDGSRIHLYGENPHGLLMLDVNGFYSLQIVSSDRTKFAANDKSKGTADEYKVAVLGSNSHFGKYTINESEHTITFQIEHASYPNWEGLTQKRSYVITGDELKYTVPAPTIGASAGAVGEVVWRRVR